MNIKMIFTFPLLLFFCGAPAVFPQGFAGADTCGACHEKEFKEWENSIHARALSKSFEKAWKKVGKKPKCLSCHTTGHQNGTRTYLFAGVTCESCHGAFKEGHPDNLKAKMDLAVNAKICAACHQNTHMEWKVSAHGQRNIRCFDCHQVHAQGLRVKGGETLCGSCHPGRLKSFSHATHHQKGLTCATCHFPVTKPGEEAIEGTGAASHTLFVGAETCSRCHEEMVHRSHKLVSLRGEVGKLQETIRVAQIEDIHKVKETVQHLEWQNRKMKHLMVLLAVAFLLAGVGIGIFIQNHVSRKAKK